jgi:hypothetical protein
MTWPEAFERSIEALCWTFIAWRVGAGAFRWWREQW